MQPSPVKGEGAPAAGERAEAPAFEASFPEHPQDQQAAPPQHAQQLPQPQTSQPQQPQTSQQPGSNNPFGASAFGAAAFAAPRQAGQPSPRAVPATPAPSLATGAEATAFPHALSPPGGINWILPFLPLSLGGAAGSVQGNSWLHVVHQANAESPSALKVATACSGILACFVAGVPARASSGIPPSPTHRPPQAHGRRTTSSEGEAPLPAPAGASSDGFDSHAFETSFPPVPESTPQSFAGTKSQWTPTYLPHSVSPMLLWCSFACYIGYRSTTAKFR